MTSLNDLEKARNERLEQEALADVERAEGSPATFEPGGEDAVDVCARCGNHQTDHGAFHLTCPVPAPESDRRAEIKTRILETVARLSARYPSGVLDIDLAAWLGTAERESLQTTIVELMIDGKLAGRVVSEPGPMRWKDGSAP